MFDANRYGNAWAALDDEEVAPATLETETVKISDKRFVIGDQIEFPDGRLYGVTRSGNLQTARVVRARRRKPTERFR